MWARTDSPTTLHSPAITAPTTKQNIKKNGSWIRQGKMGKSKQGGDTWIFSHGSRFDIPLPLILVNIMPLLNLVATNVAGLGSFN